MSKVILFQGDSITDAGRNDLYHGYGYATLVSSSLGFDNPGEYVFYNRGVGGNRILDVYSRIVRDILYLKPDYMSLLIGVNDIWHGIDYANGTGSERFERMYCTLIEDLKNELPDLKIMILEPFCLEGKATKKEEQPERFGIFDSGVRKLAAIAKNIAEKYNLVFVPLQSVFDEACKLQPPSYWLEDGVHPTHAGHELVKREWLKGFEKFKV